MDARASNAVLSVQDGRKGGMAFSGCSRLTVRGVTMTYPPSQFQHTQGVVVDVGAPPVRAVTVQVYSISHHASLFIIIFMINTPCSCQDRQRATADKLQVQAATFKRLARTKQDPNSRGCGAKYFYHPSPAGALTAYIYHAMT